MVVFRSNGLPGLEVYLSVDLSVVATATFGRIVSAGNKDGSFSAM